NLDIFEEDTGRAVYHHCDDGFGTPGSAEYALVKGKAYTFRRQRKGFVCKFVRRVMPACPPC
ncbi:MAG TPA: hypothetical protein PL016_02805, partial [Kiritimatiellia bacterium]|nr:hypothetical protein [Kiritimatiellia bacterium]